MGGGSGKWEGGGGNGWGEMGSGWGGVGNGRGDGGNVTERTTEAVRNDVLASISPPPHTFSSISASYTQRRLRNNWVAIPCRQKSCCYF